MERLRGAGLFFVGLVFVSLIVFFAVFFANSVIQNSEITESRAGESLGSVVALNGQADSRIANPPRSSPLKMGSVIRHGAIITMHESSQMTLTFNGGASIRLQPGAKVVIQRDETRSAGALVATLLEGDVDVLTRAANFRLVKDGRDVTAAESRFPESSALIVNGLMNGSDNSPEKGAVDNMKRGSQISAPTVVVETTPSETPASAPLPTVGTGDESGEAASLDSLSNNEIRKAMSSETGFYRRCYLTYLGRSAQTAKVGTTVTVGFVISNSGKVRDAKLIRSDFNDQVLNHCVLETVERTPFPAFKADDIPILEFPIELK